MNSRTLLATLALLLLAGGGVAAPAAAQEEEEAPPGEERFFTDGRPDSTVVHPESAWTPFFRHEGVAFSLIHYRRADNHNSGVVLRLLNENDHAVRYRLRMAFLSSEGEAEEWRDGRAEGVLEAGQMKTGSPDSLFWVPFTGGAGIAEIQMPAYQVVPVE